MKKLAPVLFIVLFVIIFFWQFFIKGLLPIPADTIIGLYHPFRDLYAKDYPNGIPFKNFLITDPVRQTYPWRELIVSIEKKLELPLWNPYNFSGTPLLANFQSASFYPFNLLFFLMPFALAWSLIIFLGPLLGGIFLFLYLNNLNLSKWASVFGAITFSFSGFFVAWMEWGTITHTALWLPLVLLAIDKIFIKTTNSKLQFKIKNYLWPIILVFSLLSSFFAGHLQTFFYLFIFSWAYFLVRWLQLGRERNMLFLFLALNILFLISTSIQWYPTLQFLQLSARDLDQADWNQNPGWFIPWQHLIQFFAPDFFGNPATLNYWSIFNYGEFVGYVGIIPLVLAALCLFFRKDKKTLFFGTFFFLSLIFSFPTFFAKIPYLLKVPFFNTAQPTRLMYVADFALAILSAFGFDYLLKTKKKIIVIYPLIFVGGILAMLWIFIPKEHISVVKSNLLLPTALFTLSIVIFMVLIILTKKIKWLTVAICIIIVGLTAFDLLRFGWKFTPFTPKSYLFPSTATLTFLSKNLGNNRIMATDSPIFPPNFSTVFRLQSVDGYDPLYLRRYAEFVVALERGKPDISSPFGFNRIIIPHNYESKIADFLGVKYILSGTDIESNKLIKVFQEKETRVYENPDVFPRVFFVEKVICNEDKNKVIKEMFSDTIDLRKVALVEDNSLCTNLSKNLSSGKVKILQYSENKVVLETENKSEGFIVFVDSFYPTWKVKVNLKQEKIYRTDYNFRGVIVPEGKHIVEFYNSLI